MPRTKAPKKKEIISNAELKRLWERTKEELILRHELKMEALENLQFKMHDYIEEQYMFRKMNCLLLDKTIGQIRMMPTNSSVMDTVSSGKKNTTTTSKKKRSLSCPTEDDGYLTDGSQLSNKDRPIRSSRSKFCNPLANSTHVVRKSRSLSRNKEYKTPVNKQPITTYGMITPKLKPNTPQLILRRPKRGEVAVSLEGSPLMVNPVEVDTAANLNIPLPGGELLSLQPERGLRMSLLPELDAETAKQLKVLGEHINMICAYSKSHKIVP